MKLPPFLLDQWIALKSTADPPIEFDLASSTGPVWTLRELLALSPGDAWDDLLSTPLSYTSAPGSVDLRREIAALEGVDAEEVQIVTGASEALLILFFLAAGPDANVVLPDPGFPANAAMAESLGLETRYYRLRPENRFRTDLDEIRKLVDRNTRLVLVNSPHNPTGAVLTAEEMQSLHDFCAERDVRLVSDQVYHPIYFDAEMPSAARLPHATVISDFSKALCLSGLRLGWMVDHDPQRLERYRTAHNYFTVTGNALGERLATLALRHAGEIYARARQVTQRNLVCAEQAFAQHTDTIEWLRPCGGLVAFPRLRNGSDTREFCRRLARRGVLVVPGDCFGQSAHFRLGLGASGDAFPLAMERFAEFLKNAPAI